MSQYAQVDAGVVSQVFADAADGRVPCPRWTRTGDLWNNGDPLKPDGTPYTADEKRYSIPLPVFIRRFEDPELATLWSLGVSNPAFGVLLIRALGSTELDSDNATVLAGKQAVAAVLGAPRAEELFAAP